MIPGFATFEGTSRYRSRFAQLADAGHFRQAEHVPGAGELWCPSIGLGTYLGEPDDKADREYVDAIAEALQSGINLLDTAINYRHQRSERNIGASLQKLTLRSYSNRLVSVRRVTQTNQGGHTPRCGQGAGEDPGGTRPSGRRTQILPAVESQASQTGVHT